MRRIAAVFASKRSDRSDAASSPTPSSSAASATTDATQQTTKLSSMRFFRSLSPKHRPVDPVLNRLSSSDLHPPSSSSSSSGAPTTPDDDRASLTVPPNKEWLALPHPLDHRLPSFQHLDPAPHHRPPLPPRPSASPSTLDTDDDSSEVSSIAPALSNPPERATPLSPSAYVLALTSINLRPPFAPPPLLHIPPCPVFPRSTNATRSLPSQDSLQTTMHRKKLQRRLQSRNLSPSETRSIAPFARNRVPPKERLSLHLDDTAVREGCIQSHSVGLRKWADRPCFEDRLLVLLPENVPPSPTGEPLWTRVSPATTSAVAALEYSVTLELLTGLYEEVLPRELERHVPAPDASPLGYLHVDTQVSLDLGLSLSQSPSTLSPSSSTSLPSPVTMPSPSTTAAAAAPSTSPKPVPSGVISSSQSRNSAYKASPSPLRMEAVSASPPSPSTVVVSPVSSAPSTLVASPTNPPSIMASPPTSASSVPAPLKPALKQGVRFAEEEKEDQIPLGYVMRIKQKREEKARFLQAERERRRHEEERRRHEEEKRKWEEERAAWEREKRAMEEERKKRLYADEVAAARSRRESQRFGLGTMTGDGLATGQWDRSERPRPERESSSSSYTRPAYDPAAHPHIPLRQNSNSSLAIPKPSRQGSASGSGSGSPSDSRPNSVYGSGSRPPSMHSPSSSQQDVRAREHRMSGSGSRRGSTVSEKGSGGSWRRTDQVPVPPLPSVRPMGMNMNGPPMPISAMPLGMPMQVPMYGMPMDMPLLPPSPPFMHQYGHRSPGGQSGQHPHSPQRSQSSSPTLGRHNLPASGSSERVNRMSHAKGSSASARAPSLPRSESSLRRAHHQRTASGDVSLLPSSSSPKHRTHPDDRRGTRALALAAASSSTSGSQRPTVTHSASLPSHPPPVFSQARSSWALPQTGFENVSRPSTGRRQTVIS